MFFYNGFVATTVICVKQFSPLLFPTFKKFFMHTVSIEFVLCFIVAVCKYTCHKKCSHKLNLPCRGSGGSAYVSDEVLARNVSYAPLFDKYARNMSYAPLLDKCERNVSYAPLFDKC